MWRSWAGVVTRGLRLWGRVDVLPNSLKRLWRRLIVDKWTLNSRATALVDVPAISIPIARSLKTCDICGIVLCNKTAHFRMAFYCGQPKAHLCNNGKMEMHSVANVETLHTPLATFFPSKKATKPLSFYLALNSISIQVCFIGMTKTKDLYFQSNCNRDAYK